VQYCGGGRKAKGEARGSMTDPEARHMRMANGGFNPGYNVQFATDTAHAVIVGVSVTNSGSDRGQAAPMLKQIKQRTGQTPSQYLVDGGYTDKKTVEAFDGMEVTLYGPVPERGQNDPFKALMTDSAAVSQWRKRMKTTAAQEIYKRRAPTSERVNADVRTYRTMDRMLVRGAGKVLCVALWNVLAFNLLRWLALAPIS
jgi:hypothetical protein